MRHAAMDWTPLRLRAPLENPMRLSADAEALHFATPLPVAALVSALCGAVAGAGCTTAAVYPVGGSVLGLAGSGLVLRNANESIAITGSGTFAFTRKVAR